MDQIEEALEVLVPDNLLVLKKKLEDQAERNQIEHQELTQKMQNLDVKIANLERMRDGLDVFMGCMEGRTPSRNGIRKKRQKSVRVQILKHLKKGSKTYQELADLTDAYKPTLSGVLMELKRNLLVKGTGNRKNRIYSLK